VLRRYKSTAATALDWDDNNLVDGVPSSEMRRLLHIRNVGILAHVDAGKTTVTERMLALAGVVRRAGSVDDGNTVTDYLPAERERGITIQSAAISFQWGWHNHYTGDDFDSNDNVQVHLIDTPGHVDFSVEVNRSVAVLDGAVLVVDAVAGVQAQTETVWRAMTRPSLNNHTQLTQNDHVIMPRQDHAHEPLPCLAVINKMDKEGCHFRNAIQSLRHKLPGANPIAMQLPLFRTITNNRSPDSLLDSNIIALSKQDSQSVGAFVGLVDLVHMRAIVYPETSTFTVEDNIPKVVALIDPETHKPFHNDCQVTREALAARADLIASLADVDEAIEEYYLLEEEPSNAEIRSALRRATLDRKALPVMAAAALKGQGIEPVLDSIADLLPSPLDRKAPALTALDDKMWATTNKKKKDKKSAVKDILQPTLSIGHPFHPTLLALAFKVVHMKGRGGSGDGRVVFARVYSGQLSDRDVLQVITPPAPGEIPEKPRTERVGGMLELAGGRFGNLEDGFCQSGDVCALVGLKSVVTGDTIMIDQKRTKKTVKQETVCLAGVASPKPVLTVKLEAETAQQQQQLSDALSLLVIEDPSLVVEESESSTLLSGLGELHIEITLDRLKREFGIEVLAGKPAVAYRESLVESIETPGLLNYDRTIGSTRLQAAIHLRIEPKQGVETTEGSSSVLLSEPTVVLEQPAREYLGIEDDVDDDDLLQVSELAKALIHGCQGAMKRGAVGSYALANVKCSVLNIDAEGGLSGLKALPGALRAAAANAISEMLSTNKSSSVLIEPMMSVEVTIPSDMVGTVISDLNNRRGTIGDVIIGDGTRTQVKALVRGEVPLVGTLGYASNLRSLTGGEGHFTAEYKGHSPCT